MVNLTRRVRGHFVRITEVSMHQTDLTLDISLNAWIYNVSFVFARFSEMILPLFHFRVLVAKWEWLASMASVDQRSFVEILMKFILFE